MSGIPASWAMPANRSISSTMRAGFASVSAKIAFVFGRIALRTVSESASGWTKVNSIPSLLKVLVNSETVPP